MTNEVLINEPDISWLERRLQSTPRAALLLDTVIRWRLALSPDQRSLISREFIERAVELNLRGVTLLGDHALRVLYRPSSDWTGSYTKLISGLEHCLS